MLCILLAKDECFIENHYILYIVYIYIYCIGLFVLLHDDILMLIKD